MRSLSRIPIRLALGALTLAALDCGQATERRPATLASPATAIAATAIAATPLQAAPLSRDTSFGALIQRLSEPGGFFNSDNLISNETSYLHAVGILRAHEVKGGAYLGVGPDQNFSYIAAIRPRIAYIVDIRRDNILEHFVFKALFAMARNRLEYLCLLTGRPVPADVAAWAGRGIRELVDYVDRTPVSREAFERAAAAVRQRAIAFGLPLDSTDLATIARVHTAFMESGLDLRFTTIGRAPQYYYPTLRQLLLEKDLDGRQSSYLADEGDFQFLKAMQASNLVVPIVGNLAGDRAMAAVAADIAARSLRVSAFYTSNVEFYLMGDGTFDRFADNVKRLPYDDHSVFIRSYFSGPYRTPLPQTVPGYYSTQLVAPIAGFVDDYRAGSLRTYTDVVTRRVLER